MKRFLCILLMIISANIFAQQFIPTHYVTYNLRIRENQSLNSEIITTLPQFTAVTILETGEVETINSITAPWVRVQSQTGFSGWCFSGYIEQIETNIANEISSRIANRVPGTYPRFQLPETTNIESVQEITEFEGFYVQQLPRRFQGSGHAPEILELSISNSMVVISEIDIFNGNKIIRNQITLEFDGRTFSNGNNYLKTDGDQIYIYYQENVPDRKWLGTWEYRQPYIFAGSIDAPLQLIVQQFTSDYLTNFAGRYVYESHSIMEHENLEFDIEQIQNSEIELTFSSEMKSLVVPIRALHRIYAENSRVGDFDLYFVETQADTPFHWTFGEGVGFREVRLFFYKGGIALTFEENGVEFNDDREVTAETSLKYVVYFTKVE